jgi:hypothetical protein
MRWLVGLFLVGLAATGCAIQGQSVTAPPLGEALLTPALTAEVCPGAMTWGALAADGAGGAQLVHPELGEQPVRWPDGYTVVGGPPLRVLDPDGDVVASEGETVYVGGGMDSADEVFIACGHVSTEAH